MKLISTLSLFAGLCLASPALADDNLETGLALSNEVTLKALERVGFSLPALLTQTPTVQLMANEELSTLPAFEPVYKDLIKEIPSKPMGGRPFDLSVLSDPKARFILSGVINRADRGYATGNRCGEIRFIFRLSIAMTARKEPYRTRLPMTINLVYHAGTAQDDQHCADVANSWLKMVGDVKSVDWRTNGPLNPSFFSYKNLKSLEVNIQTERSGAAAAGNFGGNALYLLKVYDWDGTEFKTGTVENQIDRVALGKNPKLLKELKAWLFDPENAKAIDDGTFILPEKFLAKKAYSQAPGGIARSANRIYFGIIKPEDVKPSVYEKMVQVRSADGFLRRLNDSTCTGCHQTRAIGGFHFPGSDPLGKGGWNSVFMPGSAHFFGDSSRRREIVKAIAANSEKIDFSRGFSARPQERRSQDLIGTGLMNGWGSHCATGTDPSFRSWSCAKGLTCKKLIDVSDKTGMGICVNEVQSIGDPCEFGKTTTKSFGVDNFKRLNEREVTIPNAMCSPQSQDPGTSTGGFLGGSVRLKSCQNGPGEPGLPDNVACGPLPAGKPGFNKCIASRNPDVCMQEHILPVGMRACDQKNPCRDDYICSVSYEPGRGVCIPPYFLFQFRVDGHPKPDPE